MVGREPYHCNNRLYDEYFLNQTGSGLPVYVRGGTLRGDGLGSVLGGLFRAAVPILKRGGKALLREGGRAGLGLMEDVLSGQSLKVAAKKRSRQAGQQLFNKVLSAASGGIIQLPGLPASKRIKLSNKPRRRQKTSSAKRAGRKRGDIFS
jgi:hypothetical protein